MDSRLHERPEAETPSVERLLERVRSGQLRLPAFQRPLRWRSRHVIELFDSIRRGFPVGDMLFSKQAAKHETVTWGPVKIDAAARGDALFVIDGQQRLVSLAGTLLHPEATPRGDIHAIWYDLEAEQFLRLVGTPRPTWLPLRILANSADLVRWLYVWPLHAERSDLLNRAIDLGRAIREYQVPAYVVSNASETTQRLIFSRMNTAGVRLTEKDVFDALIGLNGGRPLAEASTRLGSEGFGEFAEDWFLRALKAVAGLEPKLKGEELQRALESHPGAIDATETALYRVLAFLVADAGIPHIDLLPYALPLTILARFFHLYPEPTARTRLLLVRWLWRGMLSGAHAKSSHSDVRRLMGLVEGEESDATQSLLLDLPTHWEFPTSVGAWNTTSAQTCLYALAMLAQEPRRLTDLHPLDVEDVQQLDQPMRAFVNLVDPQRHSGRIVEFIFSPEKPILDDLLASNEEVLRSHVLDHAMLESLSRGEVESFGSRREQIFTQVAQRYFDERAGRGENDRPAIVDIVRKVASA